MAKQNNTGNKTSQYDKIIKENLEVTMPVIIIQYTKERKPDALKKVTDTKGDTYVLHLEFQIADEKEMVYRMVEYCAMLMRKYKLPVKQYVIF